MRWKRRRKGGTGEEQEERLMAGGQIFLDLHLPAVRGETCNLLQIGLMIEIPFANRVHLNEN